MKNKRLRVIAFQLILLLAGLLCIEAVLRLKGYQPGDMKPNWLNFEPVDSLYVIHDYYTNGDGVLVADSDYWLAQDIHVNEDGFRSPDFNKLDTGKKKILYIGDSFTWGMSAKPIKDHCFVDLVRNETKSEVINLGIPAADPAQYFQLAKKYVARLKPDMVFVMFFMGNDLMIQDRDVSTGEPYYYYTNAGAIVADMDGKHFKSAQAAYNYFVSDRYYMHRPGNFFEWLVSKSSLLSRLYSVRFRVQEKWNFEKTIRDSHVTKKYLTGIKEVARQNNVPVKFVLIPEIKEADMDLHKYKNRYSDLLLDTMLKDDWLIFPNSKSNFTPYPDAHLNNAGHRYYADRMEEFLKNYMAIK
ncbi:MAG: hypothetical protein JWO06_3072 [Bacteroidota bacterium]|nr:hypothetical protein [Bacteroidota bacterium]